MRTPSSPATTTTQPHGDVHPRPAVLGKVLRRTMVTALAAALMTGAAVPALAIADSGTAPSAAAPHTHGYSPSGDPGGW